nr:MAG TPA: hypothetical protein [Caudoviricetes sp.]
MSRDQHTRTNIQKITGKHLHGKDVCISCPIEGGVD